MRDHPRDPGRVSGSGLVIFDVLGQFGSDIGEVFWLVIKLYWFEGIGRVLNSSFISSSSMWMLSTSFCFIDTK